MAQYTIDLSGKVAVVTGTSRGIGKAIARELAQAGAAIVLIARSTRENAHAVLPGTLDETEAELRALGAETLCVQADVSLEPDVHKLRDQTLERFGRCDILVNNSAVSYIGPFLDLTVKRWDILMGVNLRGPMMLTQAFLPGMLERGEGHVINISSAAGRTEMRSELTDEERALGVAAYGTSKAALNQLTSMLDREFHGRGVAFNALEVHAATEIYLRNVANPDFSRIEMPEGPAQVVAWLAAQPTSYSGHLLDQYDLLPRLREEGLIRPKVVPA